MSVGLQSRESAVSRTEETTSEWQTHTVVDPSDRGEETEARKLRLGTHHYWRKIES